MRDVDRSDVDLVLRLYEVRRETEMRKARQLLFSLQLGRYEDLLAVLDFAHPENAHFRQLTSYWEMVADFAARELLHPEMFASHCGEGIILYLKLEPFLARVRAEYNPKFLGNLERAIRSHDVVFQRASQLRDVMARRAAAAAKAAVPPAPAPAPAQSR